MEFICLGGLSIVANNEVIVTERLTKFYGKLIALDNLTFSVKKGITGFLGPNAAGKTTAIKILMGLLTPSSGRALVLGIDPTKDPLEIKRRVGFLPENPKPYKYMKGSEFLDFVGKLRGIPAKVRKEETSKLLDHVGLTGRGKDRISTYSRGMIQRLFIAQTLIGNPDLIMLDEPTAGLDPIGREEIINLLIDLAKVGKSIFISSHILSEVEKACSYVLIIDKGQLVLEGEVSKIREDFASGRYQVKSDKPELLLKELQGKSYVKDVWIEDNVVMVMPSNDREFRKGVLELSVSLSCEIFSLEKELPSLQNVFVSLIKKRGGEIK
ncbi:MAG: ABC transporter ATP-binding protein [bacterium]